MKLKMSISYRHFLALIRFKEKSAGKKQNCGNFKFLRLSGGASSQICGDLLTIAVHITLANM